MKKPKQNVLQLNNRFIQEAKMKKRNELLENQKKNRLMGLILILVIFLFTLPAYNLVQSYEELLTKRAKLQEMKENYKAIKAEADHMKDLEHKLTDKDFAVKFVRAKYHYTKGDEFVYSVPDLLPK